VRPCATQCPRGIGIPAEALFGTREKQPEGAARDCDQGVTYPARNRHRSHLQNTKCNVENTFRHFCVKSYLHEIVFFSPTGTILPSTFKGIHMAASESGTAEHPLRTTVPISLPRSRARNAALYCTAAWSGFFVMGVELLGGRLMAPYFGSSIFVWGALITVFMTALAIGYLIGGQLSLRSPSLRGLGALLIAEAMLALPIILFGDAAFDALSFSIEDPRYGSLVAAFLMFSAPTVFSGMVSPYAVRLLINSIDHSGQSAGRLYFASTLGSAGGTILTTFYLVLFFEIDTIIVSMIAMSFAIGAILCIRGGHARAA
jgi:hypothetical protein